MQQAPVQKKPMCFWRVLVARVKNPSKRKRVISQIGLPIHWRLPVGAGVYMTRDIAKAETHIALLVA
jgi:hypothetical protein